MRCVEVADGLRIALFATLATAAISMAAVPAMAAAPAALECDRLAGSPKDAQRVAPGVVVRLLDAAAAIAACEKDLAAHPGEPRLQFNLARAREKAGDAAAAAKLYKIAADHQYAAAEIALASYLWYGRGGTPKDLGEAARLLDAAQEAGDPDAREQRKALYGDALLSAPLDAEMESFVQRAGDRGDAGALYWLAVQAGFGDETEAMRLYRKASDLGDGQASEALGRKYCYGGSGLPKDFAQAQRLFDLAVKSGDPEALIGVGAAYSHGQCGIAQNDAEAARLYKAASDKGDPNAEYKLGLFYDEGRGGLAKSASEAARLWSLAAEDGSAEAAFALGMYRLNGMGGMPKDQIEAIRLFKQAAGGVSEAKDQLAKMGISN